tara:strand:+ start:14302 stop:14889 length:588 start_codon:yes stop_codon:yes gene_type:complete
VSKHVSIKDTLTRIKELDELELVALAKKQLPYVSFAYEELMRRYQTQVHSIALRYLNNHADAEEVVHEVMLKIFVHLKKFEGRSSFKTWIYRLTYNESVDKIRAIAKHAAAHNQEIESIPAEEVEHLNSSELSAIDSWMKTLNAIDRSVVVFRIQFELDFKEIAQIVDLNLSTVKMKHKRALEKLRKSNITRRLT